MKAYLSRDIDGYNLSSRKLDWTRAKLFALDKHPMFFAFPVRRFHAMFGIRLKVGYYQQIDMVKGRVKLLSLPVKAK